MPRMIYIVFIMLSMVEVRLVDFPGHPSRQSELPPFLNNLKQVVFVLDLTQKAQDSVSFLVELFQMAPLSMNDILIVCNKKDQLGAKNKKWLRTEFNKQWDIVLQVPIFNRSGHV